MILNENIFDDEIIIEVPEEKPVLDMPEVGIDLGVSDQLIALIKDEWEAIQGYNNLLPNLTDYPEIVEVIKHITDEENKHVGELQTCLKTLSPNAESIDFGQKEAHQEMGNDFPLDERYHDKRAAPRRARPDLGEDQLEIDLESSGEIDDDDTDEFFAKYMNEDYFNSEYTPYKDWSQEDIEKHKSIDWEDRNYEEYEDEVAEITMPITKYSLNGVDDYKEVEMVKVFRSNPIYPPYYRPKEEQFRDGNTVGPMYDGNKYNGYDVHDRYETQELYDVMFD